MIIIPAETTLLGEIRSKGELRIDGRVEGLGELQGFLLLTKSALWRGKIVSDIVVIEGCVEGDIVARDRVEIMSTGSVTGKISSPKVAIKTGAKVTGQLYMAKAEAIDLLETKARRENWKLARETEEQLEQPRRIVGE